MHHVQPQTGSMTLPIRIATLIALLCLCQANGLAQAKPLELKWGELAPIITGHSVRMVLPDATLIKGEAVAVRDDVLVMDVKSTSNAKAYSKGSASIPRTSVSLIELERRRGSFGRNLGTVVGVISGVVLGGYVAAVATDSAGTGIPTFLGISAAGTIGGAYLGGQLDKQVTHIKVIP